jgi:flagellar biosynthetic protein FliP
MSGGRFRRGRSLLIVAILCPAVGKASVRVALPVHAQFLDSGQSAKGGPPEADQDPWSNMLSAPLPGESSADAAPAARNASSAATLGRPATAKTAPGGLRISGLGSSSAPWTIVVFLTFLTLIPSLMICVTPFARLLVVFHFLRQALGLQTTPSNQTLIGLSLVLTFFIMQPVGDQIYHDAFLPLQAGQITAFQAVARGSEPLRHFMGHYVREKDAALFLDIAHAPRPRTMDDIPMRVLMPAYIVSELKAGFQIGTVLFLPFLVVDLVVASITNAVGMMQLPPVVISTPLKLMLFLMVDGWHLLIGALVRSFN